MHFKTVKDHMVTIGMAISVVALAQTSGTAAQAEAITTADRDIAIIDIPHPKEGNLLMLRGLVGQGTASFRINGTCHTMPVRFVAGDFSGQSVDVGRRDAIRIVVTTPTVIGDLMAGRDLVSDMVRVTSEPSDAKADLYLAQGLSAETGFVINPGRNLFADLLGVSTSVTACSSLKSTLP